MFQNIIEVLILSVIQGVSEFLPVSSSAHLILVSSLYEFKSNSLLIDISLHLGSLLAIIYFFRVELLDVNNNKKLLSTNIRYRLRVSRIDNFLSPLLLTIPLQLLAYHVALLKNCDIDKPRNLAKSVTVE